MYDKKILNDLKEMLDISIDPAQFPYQKGNSIRIGKYAVRSNKKGYYRVFDCEHNKQIEQTFSKTAALALAKTLSKGTNNINSIIQLDKEVQKWFNDCVFYRHTMNITKDDIKYDIVSTRYEIAKSKTATIKNQLEYYIFG